VSGLGLSAWPFLGLLLLVPVGVALSRRRRRRLPLAAAGDLPGKRGSGLWASWPPALRV
jgi:hypothetical protein